MRHGADDRHAVALAGLDIGGAGKAGDIACARRKKPGLGAVRGAQTEIRENFSRRRQHHARGFRSDQRLVMQDVDQPRLDELRLRQRRRDADQRLVGKTHAALGDGVHVAGEAKTLKIIEQVLPEAAGAFQPVDVGGGKAQSLEIAKRVVEPGSEHEAAPRRQPAHEELEHRLFVLAAIQIGLDHVEFVEVGGQRTGRRHHGASMGGLRRAEKEWLPGLGSNQRHFD